MPSHGRSKRVPRRMKLLEAEPSPASRISLVFSLAWPRARCSAISRLRLEEYAPSCMSCASLACCSRSCIRRSRVCTVPCQ